MTINKRRLGVIAGTVGAVGAAAALGLGATSALYTSEAGSQNNEIVSGTIALSENETASIELNETGFMPGDSATSKYQLSYAGEDAFVGVDIKITSTAAEACGDFADGPVDVDDVMAECTETGTVPMFNGSTESGSMDLVVDYVSGVMGSALLGDGAFTNVASCSSTGGVITCVSELKNIILAPRAIGPNVPPGDPADLQDDLVWNDGNGVPVGVKMTLPLGAGNVYQGSDVHVDLTGHAVQFANNYATWSSGLADASTIRPGAAGGNPNTLRLPKSWL